MHRIEKHLQPYLKNPVQSLIKYSTAWMIDSVITINYTDLTLSCYKKHHILTLNKPKKG